ncbi:hypothetical protein [Mammaliicoccus sp. JADD-157]
MLKGLLTGLKQKQIDENTLAMWYSKSDKVIVLRFVKIDKGGESE